MAAVDAERVLWLVQQIDTEVCALAARHQDPETLAVIRRIQTANHLLYMAATECCDSLTTDP